MCQWMAYSEKFLVEEVYKRQEQRWREQTLQQQQ